MSGPLLFPVKIGTEETEAKVFYNIKKDTLRVATKGVHFIDINSFDLLLFLKKEDRIEDENHWEPFVTARKFEARTKTSSFIFKKIS